MGFEGAPADRQAQTKAPRGAVAAAVQAIDRFKHAFAVRFRDADAVIVDPQFSAVRSDIHPHLNAPIAVAHGVTQQVL